VEDANDVAGTYRAYEFDVSKFLQAGKTNALAVEVFAPEGTTWGSPGWIGIRRLLTKTWGFGRKFF